MKAKILTIVLVLISVLFAGCQQGPTNVDIINDQGGAVMGLDYRDFDQAASEMVQSMLGSGAMKKEGGGRYVVATGRIVNDTMQRINTDQLMAKIEEELLNSGQVVMTSAVGGSGAPDKMVLQARQDLRDSGLSDEFDQETVAAKGTLIAPELSISGKIIQRNVGYSKSQQQVEYYFQLKVTDMTTGLRFWQKESLIAKRGSNKSVAW
ncbi:MAG: penicillin-binding protein activator LpoB [Planctomycetes bacterium]|nr:penicillin-binding protein activator LpoB [Planctomycetota bacterium]MBL7106448.1 penicillin-binding protein activator LpoB [Phycisphaerae bacterium]